MSAATPPEDNSNKESPKNAIKCRKCRKSLMEASPDMLNEDVEACCESVQQILSVSTNADEDGSSAEIDYPSWINDQFDTAGWIRGKLLCPNCSAKVGAFNFVGGSRCQCRRSLVPSVYFVRAHVDAPVVTTPPMHQPDSGTASASQHCTTNADVNEGCGSSGGQNSNDNYEAQLKQSTNTSHVGFALIHSNEMMNIDSIYDKNADRKWDKMHRFETKLRTAIRHTRRGRVNRRVARIVKTVGYRIHEDGNASDGSCSEVEPDSGVDVEIDADAQCAVCLDVYCMPRRCAPCGHSFCGWCLRSLAHSTTSHCDEGYLCPLCRAKIVWTEEDQVCQQDVKSRYPSLMRQRMTAYRKQRRRHRWPLPEGTKCDQFLLAASMRLPRSRCILFFVILLALLVYFNSALIHQKADSLFTLVRSNHDIVSAVMWLLAVSFCFLLVCSA